jgi:hypothetical protein
MVIHGITISKDDFKFVEFEGDRIRLPPRFAEQAGLAGKKPTECLLIVITAGGYRLLTQFTDTDSDLTELVGRWEEAGEKGDALEGTESNRLVGIRAKLIPCTVSPRGPGWRVHIPKAARQLAPGDRSGVFLVIVEGQVELWFPDPLRQAVSVPITEFLS